ncbi:AbrB/MazE/SpoVT family DNA-binding domain-containing protein [Halosimplex salinum]|uniref:AbrB/MazE/SpoVT family DNA-binding domain-containing protein n=1 Tax=Halosimplex salinum TaxID=1710538 RepID=UPI000F46BCD4|nr:AbrB/MazE/SpoVT family DNA-binding domain-containing protein [Halosimplex salinum]
MAAEERRVDEKGRVTIPQSVRESLGIEPGEEVTVSVDDGSVVIRPRVTREEFVETMTGVITEETRADDAEAIDPRDLKEDWTSDL